MSEQQQGSADDGKSLDPNAAPEAQTSGEGEKKVGPIAVSLDTEKMAELANRAAQTVIDALGPEVKELAEATKALCERVSKLEEAPIQKPADAAPPAADAEGFAALRRDLDALSMRVKKLGL